MLTKTKYLTGTALDWAVAKAIGRNMVSMGDSEYGEWDESDPIAYDPLPKYSSDWAHTGPLIDCYDIDITACNTYAPGKYTACAAKGPIASGASRLIAACRAIASAELGEEVDITGDLCEVE